MVELELQRIFHKYDEKYYLGHISKDKNIFIVISNDSLDEDINARTHDVPHAPIERIL